MAFTYASNQDKLNILNLVASILFSSVACTCLSLPFPQDINGPNDNRTGLGPSAETGVPKLERRNFIPYIYQAGSPSPPFRRSGFKILALLFRRYGPARTKCVKIVFSSLH